MERRAVRGKMFFTIFSVLALMSFGTLSWAVPVSAYDFSVTVGANHNTGPIVLGNALTFDSWWYIPDPVVTGPEPWATVYIQRPDPVFGLVTLQAYYENVTSSAWAFKEIDTSAYAGQTLNILFSIDDYGYQDPNPTFFVRNLSTGASVPEPSTLLLLGSGLIGLIGYGRRRMKK